MTMSMVSRSLRRAFRDVQADTRTVGMEPLQQPVEETTRREGVDADAKLAFLAARPHSGRLDGAVENAHGVMDLIDKTASGFGQPDV